MSFQISLGNNNSPEAGSHLTSCTSNAICRYKEQLFIDTNCCCLSINAVAIKTLWQKKSLLLVKYQLKLLNTIAINNQILECMNATTKSSSEKNK